eukprot:m51a1_g5450 hypothetical protein (729) ;mRNA; r:207360-209972
MTHQASRAVTEDPMWCWDNDGKTAPYPEAVSRMIEEAFRARKEKVLIDTERYVEFAKTTGGQHLQKRLDDPQRMRRVIRKSPGSPDPQSRPFQQQQQQQQQVRQSLQHAQQQQQQQQQWMYEMPDHSWVLFAQHEQKLLNETAGSPLGKVPLDDTRVVFLGPQPRLQQQSITGGGSRTFNVKCVSPGVAGVGSQAGATASAPGGFLQQPSGHAAAQHAHAQASGPAAAAAASGAGAAHPPPRRAPSDGSSHRYRPQGQGQGQGQAQPPGIKPSKSGDFDFRPQQAPSPPPIVPPHPQVVVPAPPAQAAPTAPGRAQAAEVMGELGYPLLPAHRWFEQLTGVGEATFRASPGTYIKENRFKTAKGKGTSLVIQNSQTGAMYYAGNFFITTVGELEQSMAKGGVRDALRQPEVATLRIVTRSDLESLPAVDIGVLQASNRGAMFQAASNFNAVEGIDEETPPDSECFTEFYIWDKTQGPQASISAGAAAITRVHAAFYNPNMPPEAWRQTGAVQVELLRNLREYFTVRNGYVCLTGDEKPLPPEGSREYEDLLGKYCVALHLDVQVTYAGFEGEELRLIKCPVKPNGPSDRDIHLIDQVFCAAMNIAQGSAGEKNATVPGGQEKARFLLRAAYRGTYTAAVAYRCPRLFLTLIGGGVFGNSVADIYDIILKEHIRATRLPSSALRDVVIAHWSHNDAELAAFAQQLKSNRVKFQWVNYDSNKPTVKLEYN